MSQAKVDRYKEEKKNRKKIMAKEKRMRIAGYEQGYLSNLYHRELLAGVRQYTASGTILCEQCTEFS